MMVNCVCVYRVTFTMVMVRPLWENNETSGHPDGPVMIKDDSHAHSGKKNTFMPEMRIPRCSFNKITKRDLPGTVALVKNGIELRVVVGYNAGLGILCKDLQGTRPADENDYDFPCFQCSLRFRPANLSREYPICHRRPFRITFCFIS